MKVGDRIRVRYLLSPPIEAVVTRERDAGGWLEVEAIEPKSGEPYRFEAYWAYCSIIHAWDEGAP